MKISLLIRLPLYITQVVYMHTKSHPMVKQGNIKNTQLYYLGLLMLRLKISTTQVWFVMNFHTYHCFIYNHL